MSRGIWLNIVFVSCIFGDLRMLSQEEKANNHPRQQIEGEANDPKAIFQQGTTALANGQLEAAEEAFRRVIQIDGHSAAAFGNLGVVYMRQHQWQSALQTLHKAEILAPGMTGIRLNIGLAYYRQNKFQDAIAAFDSAAREDPKSVQARYLLGLCYFLIRDYERALNTLQSIEIAESRDLNFLYVLAISAWQSNQPKIEQRALARLVEVGENTPEFHLLMGKAHLNRDEYDDAIKELELAAQGSPKLPFVHFNLGLAYLKKREFECAKIEFL